ncbi:MAG: hypothetical protein WCO66_00840 [Candidatus Absconditabacteria bacterium]
MKLTVDHAQRFAKMRAHTAAHLLHAELVKIFPATKQAGSFVDVDYLRFDFAADRSLTPEELADIQANINTTIYGAFPVTTTETSFDEAVKLGAKAFFEDKYGDVVRLVKVDQDISTELCGGTHVANTKDIGAFALLSQEAVASGIKRISAVVGPKVYSQLVEKDAILDGIAEKLGVSAKQVSDKIEKTLKEFESMKSHIEQLEYKVVSDFIAHATPSFNQTIEVILAIPTDMNFRLALSLAREKFTDKVTLLATHEGTFALLGATGRSAKMIADDFGLKGGGTNMMVQGRDLNAVKLLTK